MNYRCNKGGILASVGFFIIFCCVFMHEDDPYFIFDTIVDFISDFSQLSSSMGRIFKSVLQKDNNIKSAISKIIDTLFTYDYLNLDNFWTYFTEKMEQFINGDAWSIWGTMS